MIEPLNEEMPEANESDYSSAIFHEQIRNQYVLIKINLK